MTKTYTTQQGDTWDAISLRVFGDERFMDRIIAKNQEHIDVAIFSAGITLKMPEVSIEDIEHSNVAPWRRQS